VSRYEVCAVTIELTNGSTVSYRGPGQCLDVATEVKADKASGTPARQVRYVTTTILVDSVPAEPIPGVPS
jgi:hypothetical protein